MKNKKIKLSIKLRSKQDAWIVFEGNFDDKGENILVEVPQVLEPLFEELQTKTKPLGYLERLESECELKL
ncbi:hypothetical protein HN865_01525 [Candidatus Woesearchaeota archaeon]|jgi:hypothetical protein|nr:hypothetical protein [Candidatus Woesearchaeota archaeon]MBT7237517.1 hypothetical protein [Candidatus Woesearchaeota archaeon]